MNKKLLLILSQLDKHKLDGLVHFCKNPAYNINKNIAHFFLILSNFYPAFEIDKKNIANIYTQIFESPLNQNHFNNFQTHAYKVLLEFLAHLNLNSLENKSFFYLKELLPISKELVEKELTILKNQKSNFEDYYLEQFRSLNFYFDFMLNKSAAERKKIDFDNEDALFMLTCFYYKNRLKYACEMINVQSILKTKFDESVFEKEANYCLTIKFENELSIKLYALSFLLMKNQATDVFETIKTLLFKKGEKIDKSELKSFYAILQNFCIRKFNAGNTQFLNELFIIYKQSLEIGLLTENKKMLSSTFKNIIFVGLKLKEFNWVEHFIENNVKYLPENERENAQNFSMARINFAKKAYDKVLEKLLYVEFTDVFYQLDAKSLLLKTYYETESIDSLQSLLESFKILLLRQKNVTPQHIQLYKNLVSTTKKLISNSATNKKYVEKLKVKINQQAIADKTWVLEKVEELL